MASNFPDSTSLKNAKSSKNTHQIWNKIYFDRSMITCVSVLWRVLRRQTWSVRSKFVIKLYWWTDYHTLKRWNFHFLFSLVLVLQDDLFNPTLNYPVMKVSNILVLLILTWQFIVLHYAAYIFHKNFTPFSVKRLFTLSLWCRFLQSRQSINEHMLLPIVVKNSASQGFLITRFILSAQTFMTVVHMLIFPLI